MGWAVVESMSCGKASAGDRMRACAVLLVTLLATLTFFAGSAFAAETDAPDVATSQDTSVVASADATSSSEESVAASSGIGFFLGNDYVWAGESIDLDGVSINNDILAAGRSVSLGDSSVGGSVRAAGQNVSLRDVVAAENVTIAGESLSVAGGKANAVCMASRTATFEGECSDLRMYAGTVTVNGIVHGDVYVAAEKVEIGPDARIEGTLHATASAEPDVAKTAQIGKLDVSVEQGPEISSAQISGMLTMLASMLLVLKFVVSIAGTLVIAVLAEWLFKRHTATAALMIRTRTGATIGTGIIGALFAPIAIIILCCLVVTLPVAGALSLVLVAMTIVAKGFMGASVFKLAFPNLGRFKCALIGGAIMGVVGAVPFVGLLVGAAAFMYFLGYVLQTIFLSLRKSDELPYA